MPEPLPHAQGVVADPSSRLGGGEADQLQHLVDAAAGETHRLLGQGEDLATGASGVLRGRVQQDPDLEPGVGQLGEPAPGDLGGAVRGRGQADDDPHRRRLAGSVGPEEPGDPARLGGERDVVHGDEPAVPHGE